jgi:NTE family protein
VAQPSSSAKPKARAAVNGGLGLVLSGGGARGLAHVGVLRAMQHLGIRPSVIVGVSMGSIVAATYGLNRNWYRALVDMDVSGYPRMPNLSAPGILGKLSALRSAEQAISGMYFGWGIGQSAVDWGRDQLNRLTMGKRLEDSRLPVIVTATDLRNGARVVFRDGPAAEAIYASSALAGILPPATIGGRMLADGGYADIAPVDLARAAGAARVVAVDASTSVNTALPQNGFQAMLRGVEICQNEHSALRFALADMVLRPVFEPPVAVLDFSCTRDCVAAGACAALQARQALRALCKDADANGRSGAVLPDPQADNSGPRAGG